MSSLLKDWFSPAFYSAFSDQMHAVQPHFPKAAFQKAIFNKDWPGLELKGRMRHTATVLHSFLSPDFTQAATTLMLLVKHLQKQGVKGSIVHCFLPDYIEVYGIDHYQQSVKAFETITTFITCEFAVRPFMIRYEKEMLVQMVRWSTHRHEQVRRLASEGARPRLPWAMALPALKKNPEPLLEILENLKADPSETVRRSVANNLNDIAKDHPAFVLGLVKKWKGISPETDWVIRHGSRTLLKQGDVQTLACFGISHNKSIQLKSFEILTQKVRIGAYLVFQFSMHTTKAQLIRIEYAVYYQKANGTLSKKIFKISERNYAKNEMLHFTRKHPFKIITTRTFHKGLHRVALVLNGKEFETHDFLLLS